jgi:hypothetical protein
MNLEDITKKYTNIKLRKVTPEKAPSIESPPKEQPSVAKITPVVEVLLKKILPEPAKTNQKPIEQIQRSFMCISCSEKFHSFIQLENHLKSCKTTSTQQFKCFCGKVLASRKDLSNHVSVQHKQNKQKHLCTTCKKVFTSSFNLQNHMMMHKSPHGSLKGIYLCHECHSKHPDLESLKNHRAICKKKSPPEC